MTRADLAALAVRLTGAVQRIEADYGALVALAGRLAMLGGAAVAALPALSQLWHLDVTAALSTLGHAAVMAGLAASMGGRAK